MLRDSLLTFEQYQNQCQNIENAKSHQKIAKKRNIGRKIIDKKIQKKIVHCFTPPPPPPFIRNSENYHVYLGNSQIK